MTAKAWDSPVGKQHDITSLPTLWLYDGKKRISADQAQIMAFLSKPAR